MTWLVVLVLGLIWLASRFEGFRMACFAVLGICIGLIAWLIDFGSDKPQTLFYSHASHPAFLMRAGDSCPAERHVWNGWCVK
jgi:hypothetical protein